MLLLLNFVSPLQFGEKRKKLWIDSAKVFGKMQHRCVCCPFLTWQISQRTSRGQTPFVVTCAPAGASALHCLLRHVCAWLLLRAGMTQSGARVIVQPRVHEVMLGTDASRRAG